MNSKSFFSLLLISSAFLLYGKNLYAQENYNRQLIEEYVENLGSETDFDYDAYFESLDFYTKKPLNLNAANRGELESLGLLSTAQIDQFIAYRNSNGKLIAIHELQAIDGYNLETINRILPFVQIGSNLDDYRVGLGKMLTKGKNELYLRYRQFLEEKAGYIKDDAGESKYLGNPGRIYARFRHQYEYNLSYGVTAEKDPGEEFFSGSNSQGFDFYSAHFYARRMSKTFRAIALGDYTINLGQGLIASSAYGGNKSAFIESIRKPGRIIKPYTSVGESDFLRGAAIQLGLPSKFELTLFGSYRNKDANITGIDTSGNDPSIVEISSLQNSGLHRTNNEIEDESAIQVFSTGINLKKRHNRWHVGVNAIYQKLSAELNRSSAPYNQNYFSGTELGNISMDYSVLIRNLNFFGETAMSDNGGIASVNGALIGLDRRVDFALFHRYLSTKYQTVNGNVLAESSAVNNESGLFTGVVVRFDHEWSLRGYYDLWSHPWLRFGVDAPSGGYEGLVRLNYRKKRKFETYVQWRYKEKEQNVPNNETPLDILGISQKSQLRFHISYQLNKSLELRNRIEYILFKEEGNSNSQGYMAFQDIIYKPINSPISLTARYALFSTDNYDSRIYAYENDLLYAFSIPAYYDKGSRYYLNLRYRPNKLLTLELRFAQLLQTNRNTISSGNEQIDGNTRTEIKTQVRLSF